MWGGGGCGGGGGGGVKAVEGYLLRGRLGRVGFQDGVRGGGWWKW